eukprot:1025078-Prymnesium_polylepis.1
MTRVMVAGSALEANLFSMFLRARRHGAIVRAHKAAQPGARRRRVEVRAAAHIETEHKQKRPDQPAISKTRALVIAVLPSESPSA